MESAFRSAPADILDIALAFADAQTEVELTAVARTAFATVGADVCVTVDVDTAACGPDVKVRFGQTRHDWEAHYAREGYARHDPIVKHMLRSTEGLFWSDVVGSGPELIGREDEVMAEARNFGLNEGYVAPAHRPGGATSAVLVMGADLDPRDPRRRQTVHLLCVAFGAAARRIEMKTQARRSLRLSRREEQTLYLVRQGRSDKEIAQALGIFPTTAKQYVRSSQSKLTARNRSDAAARAAQLGLLPAWIPELHLG